MKRLIICSLLIAIAVWWVGRKPEEPPKETAEATEATETGGTTSINYKDAIDWYNTDVFCYKRKAWSHAIFAFSVAIRANPTLAEAHYSRGQVHARIDDNDRAIADYGEAIRLRPDWAEAYYDRAIVHAKTNDNDKAIADYGEAIRLRPDWAEAYCNRAIVHKMTNEHAKAIADCSEVIRRKPSDDVIYVNAYVVRGEAYVEQGRYDLAIADCGMAIQRKPDFARAYLIRSRAYKGAGDKTRSDDDFTKALVLGMEVGRK